ncbi:acyltransferase family protein [Chryseobacterium potabilaquae]|uniref:Acyltransferase 3 domain-containing protein n=1 Tax=Chryseobacterium potabilaquae TaxID=2675057 RepID=A0A6N4X816_9FLAO|nr:acyltransferase [Chryseobacterium potabilaquae]CAA7194369.1 hypothetical protein CHRY9293_00701 [Chryseobacterium potabilaquae]
MKLNNLQILRGISALLVCCFHLKEYINFTSINLGDILFGNGSIGVPIFFVISGFIMTYTTYKINIESGNLKKEIISFYKKRITRIVPLYYLLTLGWMIMGGNFLLYFYGEYFSRLLHSVLFLPQKNTFPVLYLGWSLNYEMFFYLIFGIFLFFSNKKRYLLIIAFFVTSYFLGHIFKPEHPYLLMITNYLNLYFVAGIILSLLLKRYSVPKNYAIIISSIGILFFVLILLNIIRFENNLLTLFTVSLFVFSFLLFDYTFQYKGNKFLIFLGDISYSFYLSHPFVEIFFRRFKVDGYINLPYFAFKIIIAIVVAAFLHHFIEKKITKYII